MGALDLPFLISLIDWPGRRGNRKSELGLSLNLFRLAGVASFSHYREQKR